MDKTRIVLSVLLVVMVTSCNRYGIGGIPVKLVKAEKVLSVDCDTCFNGFFPEVSHCMDMHIINDTILVLRKEVCEDDPYNFVAYSTRTFNCMGAFAPKGRGPGEFLSPRIARNNSRDKYLCISDVTVGRMFMVDVTSSLALGRTVVTQEFVYPENTVDCVPLSGSAFLTMNESSNEWFFSSVDSNADTHTFHPYSGLDAERYATHLSNMMTCNESSGLAAVFQVMMPQFSILDTKLGEIRSIAVDKAYRRWKQFLNSMLGVDSIDYHVGVASTPRFIFSSYWGKPIRRAEGSDCSSSIHIHDWTGKFLYEIKVKEDIGHMSFDERNGLLYCLNNTDGRIVRYDLSRILE